MDIEALDLNRYLLAAQARAKVQLCAQHVPDIAKRLNDWMKFHQASLDRGAKEAERRGLDDPPGSVERFAALDVRILESLPADDRERRCNDLQDRLAVPSSQ